MVNFIDKFDKKAEANMAHAVKRSEPTIDALELQYQDITTLFDHAEALVTSVESPLAADPDQQLLIVEPLIMELGDAADVLSEEFILIAEGTRTRTPSKASKKRIETALRKLYTAVGEYHARVREAAKQTGSAIQNIADPVVANITRQIERIVAVFIEYVQLSLQNIMNHAELAQLKVREAGVALMMHQWSQQVQQ